MNLKNISFLLNNYNLIIIILKPLYQIYQFLGFMEIENLEQCAFLDLIERQNKNINRLYVSWRNSKGFQCKMIGPQTKCFCNHRFKEHQHLNPVNRKIVCNTRSCKCKLFQYVPTHGSYDFKCLCKHSFKQHQINSKKCQRDSCNCNVFGSPWTCSCGQKYSNHKTIYQTFDERKNKGKAVNDLVRMNNELQGNLKEGSLYRPISQDDDKNNFNRPIKQDKFQRLKKYQRANKIQRISKLDEYKPSAQNEQDDIQQLQF